MNCHVALAVDSLLKKSVPSPVGLCQPWCATLNFSFFDPANIAVWLSISIIGTMCAL
jgi:hypothetical protein